MLLLLYHECETVFWCFFFKQKTAYEMRISDWSSDVCSSDLPVGVAGFPVHPRNAEQPVEPRRLGRGLHRPLHRLQRHRLERHRSEEHTSELQSLMRISYAVFCLKNKKKEQLKQTPTTSKRRNNSKDSKSVDIQIHKSD